MSNCCNSTVVKFVNSLFELSEGGLCIHMQECVVMNRLKTKFYPDRLFLIEFFYQIKYVIWKAITSCSNRKCYNLWKGNRFLKDLSKIGNRCIGIGVCLKIGNKFVAAGFLCNPFLGILKLFRDTLRRFGCKISRATFTAESAALGGERSIAIGTGHPAS